MRTFNGIIAGYILYALNKFTPVNYAFSKAHRHNETIIYKMIDTVGANCLAFKLMKG